MPIFKIKKWKTSDDAPRKASSLSNLAAALDISERADEFCIDFGETTLKLEGNVMKFVNGKWRVGESYNEEIESLKRKNELLLEENDRLNLKIDILVDMLTESTVESQILEKERDLARNTKHFSVEPQKPS